MNHEAKEEATFDVQKLRADFMAQKFDKVFSGNEKEALSRLFQEREFEGKDFGRNPLYLSVTSRIRV